MTPAEIAELGVDPLDLVHCPGCCVPVDVSFDEDRHWWFTCHRCDYEAEQIADEPAPSPRHLLDGSAGGGVWHDVDLGRWSRLIAQLVR